MIGADWRALNWYEYQSRLWHWNQQHGDTSGVVEPDYERIKRMMVH